MKKFLMFSVALAICVFTGLFVLGALSQMAAIVLPNMQKAHLQSVHPEPVIQPDAGGVQVHLDGLMTPWAQTAESIAAPVVSWATILLALIVFVVVLPVGMLMIYALWRRIRRGAREEEEHRMMHDLYARSTQMADRLESLETVLLQQQGHRAETAATADRR